MEQNDKDFYKSLLVKEKENLLGTLRKMDEHGIGNSDEMQIGELSMYDNHPADMGTQLYNLGMNKNLRENEKYQLGELDDALEKLGKGNYGQCEVCGQFIGRERLKARPQARLCIKCAESRDVELEDLMKQRPVEEKVLSSPAFDKGYPDERDDDEYEGIDQSNDLMKYGSSSTPQDMGPGKEYKEFYTNKVDRQGIVDPMDNVSNEDYEKQLPD